jgi:hypothetical protein
MLCIYEEEEDDVNLYVNITLSQHTSLLPLLPLLPVA